MARGEVGARGMRVSAEAWMWNSVCMCFLCVRACGLARVGLGTDGSWGRVGLGHGWVLGTVVGLEHGSVVAWYRGSAGVCVQPKESA